MVFLAPEGLRPESLPGLPPTAMLHRGVRPQPVADHPGGGGEDAGSAPDLVIAEPRAAELGHALPKGGRMALPHGARSDNSGLAFPRNGISGAVAGR